MKKNNIYKLTTMHVKKYYVFELEEINYIIEFTDSRWRPNKEVDISYKDHLLYIKKINDRGDTAFLHLKTNSLIIESNFYTYRVT